MKSREGKGLDGGIEAFLHFLALLGMVPRSENLSS